jgi:hypothetical protein
MGLLLQRIVPTSQIVLTSQTVSTALISIFDRESRKIPFFEDESCKTLCVTWPTSAFSGREDQFREDQFFEVPDNCSPPAPTCMRGV